MLLQLSVYRKLFSFAVLSNISGNQCEKPRHDRPKIEAVVTYTATMESHRLGLRKSLSMEAESVMNIVVRLSKYE